MRFLFISVVFFFTGFGCIQAQTTDVEKALEQIKDQLELISSNSDQELDFNTLLDELTYYFNNPLNLDAASHDDLQNLYLLSELQINALLSHIEKNGKLIALEELQTIDGFDLKTIRAILPFVKIGTPEYYQSITFPKVISEGKNVLFVRIQQVPEESKGFSAKNPETNDTSRYLGSPLKLYTRYRYTFSNQLSAGITAEKDAGEEFFSGTQNQGFDFYSAHLFYNSKGLVQKIAVGDFQLQYGQGLVLWSGLAYGKSADVMNIKKNARGLLPYTSANENLFMRGVGVSLGKKRLKADLFFSSNKIDANLSSPDTLTQEDIFTSFQESGYHRTYAELSDKDALRSTFAGGHLDYNYKTLKLGFTGYATYFDKNLDASTQLYKQFEFSGDHNTNFGVDYSYAIKNFSFFGETGLSKNKGLATINGVLISLDPRVAISIVQRYYERNYQALLSNALAENSKTANEQGMYFGLSTKLSRSLNFNAYFDRFKFPWLRYGVDAPSAGYEYIAQLNYVPSKTVEIYGRVKHTTKGENNTDRESMITPVTDLNQTNYRLHVWYKLSETLSLANRVEVTAYEIGNTDESGFLIYQDISYKSLSSRFTFSLRYALFDSDSYDSRIYTYEQDVLYAYSIPAYYYEGSRFYLVVKCRVTKGVDVWLRYAQTSYANQDVIGSGLDEIDGNHKSELKAQVRFSF